jgi:uncharacterized membrane protein
VLIRSEKTDAALKSPFEPAPPRPASEAQVLHKPVFIAFLLLLAFNWVVLALKIELPAGGRWIEALLPLFAAATLLVGLARRLPLQNVVMSILLIATCSGLLTAVGVKTGIPFGPLLYTEALGEKIFDTVPWMMLWIWIIAMISSRGVARLIVRPWRKTSYYGFWVIGLTIALVLILDLGLEPYAAKARRYWIWRATDSLPHWYDAPLTNLLGWAVTALGVMVLTTPWLINKQPVKQPTDYHPLGIWLLLNLYLATGNALREYWLAVIVCLGSGLAATVFAIRGGRW